jgi:hypothetical protein
MLIPAQPTPHSGAAEAPETPREPVLPAGGPVYTCYRYESSLHGPIRASDDTIVVRLPDNARDWAKNPFHQFAQATWPTADEATGWLGDELQRIAKALRPGNPEAARSVEAVLDGCADDLDTLQSACQTVLHLPGAGTIALAIVARWQAGAIHPLVAQGAAARSEAA